MIGVPFTVETAAAAREKLDAQRVKYKEKYLDEDYWQDLANVRGVRLPPYYTAPTDADIKYWLKIAKVSYHQFVESFGWATAEEFERMNPNHGMKILAGLILELGQENVRLKKLARERVEESEARLGKSEAPKLPMYRGKSKIARRKALAEVMRQ